MKFRKLASLQFMYEISEDGTLRNVKSKKIKEPYLGKNGYLAFSISNKGKTLHPTVHSLVAEAWIGSRPEGFVIDHIDRCRTNNNASNLRYCTVKVNNNNISDKERARRVKWAPNMPHDHLLDRGSYTYVNDEKFRSIRAAARFIAEQTGAKYTTIYGRMAARKQYILGYHIHYTN